MYSMLPVQNSEPTREEDNKMAINIHNFFTYLSLKLDKFLFNILETYNFYGRDDKINRSGQATDLFSELVIE